jgi:hypothetical protein
VDFLVKEMVVSASGLITNAALISYSIWFERVGMNGDSKSIMHVQNHVRNRIVLSIAALAFALAGGLPKKIRADELKEAKVTQVIQDVQVLPSNASPRPAAVNDSVRFKS